MKKIVIFLLFVMMTGSFCFAGEYSLSSRQASCCGMNDDNQPDDIIIGDTAKLKTPAKKPQQVKIVKRPGFRIKFYIGKSGREGRLEAEKVAADFSKQMSMSAYASYEEPRWICCAGDFTNKSDADAWLKKIKASRFGNKPYLKVVATNVFVRMIPKTKPKVDDSLDPDKVLETSAPAEGKPNTQE